MLARLVQGSRLFETASSAGLLPYRQILTPISFRFLPSLEHFIPPCSHLGGVSGLGADAASVSPANLHSQPPKQLPMA